MVTIIPNGGSVNLESTIQITEGVANIVKANKKSIAKLAKELNLEFHISREESGNYALRFINTVAQESVSVVDVERFNEIVNKFTNAIEKNDFHENVPAQQEDNVEETDLVDMVHTVIGDKIPYTLILAEEGGTSVSGTMPVDIAQRFLSLSRMMS